MKRNIDLMKVGKGVVKAVQPEHIEMIKKVLAYAEKGIEASDNKVDDHLLPMIRLGIAGADRVREGLVVLKMIVG